MALPSFSHASWGEVVSNIGEGGSLLPSLPPGYLPPSMHARVRMRVAGGEESESTLSAKFCDGHCDAREGFRK